MGGATVPTAAAASLSVAGVYVGNTPADVLRYEQWLGHPTASILGFTGQASWTDYDGSVGWAIGYWSIIDRKVYWPIPLFPNGATLADAASGIYDSHYTMAAKKLIMSRPQDAKIHIRTGWEFNGNWFPWTAAGKAKNFVAAYRRFVIAFRAVATANGTPNRFVFEWNTSIGDNGMNPEDAYPGDDYVDIIGMDVYWFALPRFNAVTQRSEQWDPADPSEAWNKQLTRAYGLNWHEKFALEHAKPMAYPEWGIESDNAAPYILNMAAWMKANNIVYQMYWDSTAGAYPGILSNNANPNAGAAYQTVFR